MRVASFDLRRRARAGQGTRNGGESSILIYVCMYICARGHNPVEHELIANRLQQPDRREREWSMK